MVAKAYYIYEYHRDNIQWGSHMTTVTIIVESMHSLANSLPWLIAS